MWLDRLTRRLWLRLWRMRWSVGSRRPAHRQPSHHLRLMLSLPAHHRLAAAAAAVPVLRRRCPLVQLHLYNRAALESSPTAGLQPSLRPSLLMQLHWQAAHVRRVVRAASQRQRCSQHSCFHLRSQRHC